MVKKYYVDTSIWIDIYEDRIGFANEPIGEYALRLFSLIILKKHTLVITDLLIEELGRYYSEAVINGMMAPFAEVIEKIVSTSEECEEAEQIAKERRVPKGDALHAVLARNNELLLVTRDKHFRQIADISKHYKPEDLI